MNKRIAVAAAALGIGVFAQAAVYKICDFEDYEIGKEFTLTTLWGGDGKATGTVEADPANSANKVLHVKLGGEWNVHPDFALPEELTGKALTDKYGKLSLLIYRHPPDQHGQLFQINSSVTMVIPIMVLPESGQLMNMYSLRPAMKMNLMSFV